MNLDLVFAKTREGEDAVEQRTRLVQRNLRTVLILVDGRTAVGDLVAKAGSMEILEDALTQLERDGFIRLLSGERASSGAVASMDNFLEPPTDVEFPAMSGAQPRPAEVSTTPFGVPPPVTIEVSITQTMPETSSQAPARTSFPVPPEAVPNPFAPPVSSPSASSHFSGAPANPFQAPAANPFSAPVAANPFQGGSSFPGGTPNPFQSPGAPARTEVAEDSAASTGLPDVPEPATTEPISLRGGKPLITGKRLGYAAGALVIGVLAAGVFYPYDNYRPRIAAALSGALGQEVHIEKVSGTLLPFPALVVSQLTVGASSQGEAIVIGEIRAAPSIGTLFGGATAFRKVTLSGAKVPLSQLGLLATGISAVGNAKGFSVGKVEVERMNIGFRDLSLQDYSGRAELTADGGVRHMELKSKDGALALTVGPGASATDPAVVTIEGQGWKSSEGSPFVFDSIAINGRLLGSRFVADKFEGRIFGGVVQGQLQLDWSSGMMVAGDVNVDFMSGPLLGTALGTGSISVDGQVSARVRFNSSGESWSAIAGKIPLEGTVLAKTGALNGLDFVEAVRRGSKLATRGGATRYEQLSSKFRWDGTQLRLSEIDLSSGAVRVGGSVSVAKAGNIDGAMTVVLHSSAATLRNTVAVDGTLKDPQLFGGR